VPSPVSVVIPAHDEGSVLRRCLDALTAGAAPGELEIVVVANGCTDDTASVARVACPEAVVLELDVASKSAALNAGDHVATRFPRFYVDADIELGIDAVRATAAALVGGCECAAPAPYFETRDRTPFIRAFYDAWQRLPYLQGDVVGNGVYALSAAGRARFREFPALTADDQFVLLHFRPGERRVVRDARFTIHPPRTVGGLLRVRRRATRGTDELTRAGVAPYGADGGSVRAAVRLARRPARWPALAVWGSVTIAAKAWARLPGPRGWERDDSARTVTPTG
jgi:glycosyltransferase involved in cell wall biosynthesis